MTTYRDSNNAGTSALLRPWLHSWAQQSGALSALPDAPVVADRPHRVTVMLTAILRRLPAWQRAAPGPEHAARTATQKPDIVR
jgi:hypothetical protein